MRARSCLHRQLDRDCLRIRLSQPTSLTLPDHHHSTISGGNAEPQRLKTSNRSPTVPNSKNGKHLGPHFNLLELEYMPKVPKYSILHDSNFFPSTMTNSKNYTRTSVQCENLRCTTSQHQSSNLNTNAPTKPMDLTRSCPLIQSVCLRSRVFFPMKLMSKVPTMLPET